VSRIGWIIFGAIIVLFLGGLVIYQRSTNPPLNVSDVNTNAVIAASDQNGQIADHVFGINDSKVVLIEYGDFQCPSCGNAHPKIKEITEAYKDRITFIFRNFPLTANHPNARAASGAVEAAGLQGKYWEMHDLVFESQNEWSGLAGEARTNKFTDYAISIGLDKDKFLTDVASADVNKKISFDQALGKKVNVSGTPTFVLNGEKVSTEISNDIVQSNGDQLKAAIDKLLAE